MPKIQKKQARIVLTGGGTGGHFYPLLAVAVELQILASQKNIDLHLYYVGAVDKHYRRLFLENNISVCGILNSKLRREFSLMNLFDLPKFVISMLQSLWFLFWIMPDCVFSKGGPGSLGPIFAALFYRIPIMAHESDSVPGISTSITSRFAKMIFLAFAETKRYLPANRPAMLVGNPIRRELISNITRPDIIKKFLGFEAERPLILVLGGSQGAQRINAIILNHLPVLLKNYQIFHQVGEKNYADFEKSVLPVLGGLARPEAERYLFVDYFKKDLQDALAAADLVVSRAGSGAIFEIAAFGKPSILIPLPEAAGNHQLQNARIYASAGAAVVIEEKDFSSEIFLQTINQILGNPDVYAAMSEKARAFSRPEAALIIANKILELI